MNDLFERVARLSPEKRRLLEDTLGRRSSLRPRDGRPPETPAERALAAVWSDVLGVDGVSADDDFFELGGDSIVSIQIVARARLAGLELSTRTLFDHPTLGELARRCRIATGSEAEDRLATVGLPPTSGQAWWIDATGLLEQPHFRLVLGLHERVALDDARRAIECMLEAHAALRTTWSEDGRLQRVAPEIDPVALEVESEDADVERALDGLAETLDPGRGRLLAARAVCASDGSRRMCVVVHRLAADARSLRVLLEDFAACVQACGRGAPPAVLPEVVPYAQVVERRAAWASRAQPQPARRGAVEAGTPLGPQVLEVGAETAARLGRLFGRSEHTPSWQVLLASWARLVMAASGSQQVSIDVELEEPGRGDPGAGSLERTVGLLAPPRTIEVAASRGAELGDVLRATKRGLQRAASDAAGVAPTAGTSAYLGILEGDGRDAERSAVRVVQANLRLGPGRRGRSRHTLACWIERRGESLGLRVESTRDLGSRLPGLCARMLADLESAACAPQALLARGVSGEDFADADLSRDDFLALFDTDA